jgi:hypothetical protein
MVPKQRSEMRKPLLPSNLYLMRFSFVTGSIGECHRASSLRHRPSAA